jgi:hypothetical protein
VRQMEFTRALGEQQTTRNGLGPFKISDDQSSRFAESVDVKIFTPGANYGIPLSLANQLSPPSNAKTLRKLDADLYKEMCAAVTDAFLDRIYPGSNRQSYERERAFMHTLMKWCWDKDEGLVAEAGLRRLQDLIIDPPFTEVGGVPVTEFIDKGARRVRLRDKLATQLAEPENRWYIGDPLTADMLRSKKERKNALIGDIGDASEYFRGASFCRRTGELHPDFVDAHAWRDRNSSSVVCCRRDRRAGWSDLLVS